MVSPVVPSVPTTYLGNLEVTTRRSCPGLTFPSAPCHATLNLISFSILAFLLLRENTQPIVSFQLKTLLILSVLRRTEMNSDQGLNGPTAHDFHDALVNILKAETRSHNHSSSRPYKIAKYREIARDPTMVPQFRDLLTGGYPVYPTLRAPRANSSPGFGPNAIQCNTIANLNPSSQT